MKNFIVIFFAALFIASSADATQGVFIGLDGVGSIARHKYHVIDNGAGNLRIDPSYEGITTKGHGIGFGLNTGFRVDVDEAFIAPEIFYDYLNNSARDLFASVHPNEKQDTLEVRDRYGAKINFGFNIMGGFNVFADIGMANVNYAVRWPSEEKSKKSSQLAMVYGGGFLFDINDSVSFKVAYDRQQFDMQYYYKGLISQVTLETARMGIIYNF